MSNDDDDDDAAGDDDDDKAGGEDNARLKGNWKVKPHADDMRELKVMEMALRPNGSKDKLKQKMKPPPNKDELALYDEVRELANGSADRAFLSAMMAIIKGAKVEIADS